MHVCVITHSEQVGRRHFDVFWGVAVDEVTAREHVLRSHYAPGTDPEVLDDGTWFFTGHEVFGSCSDNGRF